MVNPFDRTFFKFIIGFALMLVASFSILYFVNKHAQQAEGREINTAKEVVIKK
jgi:hypothetical protein